MSHDLDSSIWQVGRVASDPKGRGLPGHEVAEPHPLHRSGDKESDCHAGRALRARSHSRPMGSTEIPMMATITRLKFWRTTGRLPNR